MIASDLTPTAWDN